MMKVNRQPKNKSAILRKMSSRPARKIADEQTDKLIVQEAGTIYLIDKNQIQYCRADGNYTSIILRNRESILASKSLKVIEAELNDLRFYRIHQSLLVRLTDIFKIEKDSVEMLNGQTLVLSRRRRKELLQLIRPEIK